jgi:hypothetical protein
MQHLRGDHSWALSPVQVKFRAFVEARLYKIYPTRQQKTDGLPILAGKVQTQYEQENFLCDFGRSTVSTMELLYLQRNLLHRMQGKRIQCL